MIDQTVKNLYQELIIDAAATPANFGHFTNKADISTEASGANASCGDTLLVELKISPDKTRLTAMRWVGNGCILSRAAMSLLSEFLIDKKVADIKKMQDDDLLQLIGLNQIAPGRSRCLALGLRTVKSALEKLDSKN